MGFLRVRRLGTRHTSVAEEKAMTADRTDQPSARQLLHAATGDRDAEAKALADRADADVREDDAKRAVELAHGDVHGEPKPDQDVASPDDAEAVRRVERTDTGS
jgi:hypothetical protein